MDRPAITLGKSTLGRPRMARRLALGAMLLVLVTTGSGCQIVIGVLMMLQGRPLLDADFKLDTRRKMTEKGKQVVVLCSANDRVKSACSSIELDLIAELSRHMRVNKIDVVDPNRVASWVDDRGGEIEDADLHEVGKHFKADYVVHVKVKQFTYREENSANLYRGRMEALVSVIAFDKATGSKTNIHTIYKKPFSSVYPVHQPISNEHRHATVFLKEYLDRVGEELARLFYDHRPGEDM